MKTTVTRLCGSIVSSRFLNCFFSIEFNRFGTVETSFYCFGMPCARGLEKASFKMTADKNFICFHANKSYQPHQYVFVLLVNMTSHA